MRLRLTSEVLLLSLMAGSTCTVLAVIVFPRHINGSRLLLLWTVPLLTVALLGSMIVAHRTRDR